METGLLERDAELAVLSSALARAGSGGSVVLLGGEAGIGKTSVVRAFARAAGGPARVLVGACDDLIAPRALGPLQDVARLAGGPLAVALADGDRDAVLTAVLGELSDPALPTVLVVEDVHWADDATLDVLRFVGRRIPDLPAVLVLTYRDDEIGRDHPLQRVLGALGGDGVHRLHLDGLSPAAVARLAGGTAATSAALFRLTAGNPFFVTEALAAPAAQVPATVVDAVLARVRRLDPLTQAALDQLAVVPSRVELPLARALLGELTMLASAERFGVLEVRADSIGFRHELARRAVQGSLAATVRMQLNARVLVALLDRPGADLARIVHHAVQAGDDAAVAAYAPRAARQACAAGAQSQGAALYEHALRRRHLLAPVDQAAITEGQAWALFHCNRRQEALRVAEDAVELYEGLGDNAALGRALACLSVQQWSDLQPAAALESANRAAQLLKPVGESADRVFALMYRAVILVNLDQEHEALACLEPALAMAERTGAHHLVPLGMIYRGRARLQLGEEAGLEELLRGLEAARIDRIHESVLWGYHNLAGVLWRLGRYEELSRHLDAGAEYGQDHDFPTHNRGREAFRYRLLALRGAWDSAEEGLRQVLGNPGDQGVLGRHALPGLAQLAARRGRQDAAELLAVARANAERAHSLPALVAVTAAELEHAWLTDRPAPTRVAVELLGETDQTGRERDRGVLLRWLRRVGEPVAPFPGCPPELAAGIRGDWKTAAAGWERLDAPYERALELLDSGEVSPTLEALTGLDSLGAQPAAALARQRLRGMGMNQVPRGPQPTTRANPAGLTARQVEILQLLGQGLTNAEIAARLVVSVRTVDHHVSAVLQKLNITSRREAAATAERLGLGSA
jgi:DNA-binding CsgD family transcriptional regulator/tetratricopeptide (TPR) repeat protein